MRQAITWINSALLSIERPETHSNEIRMRITFWHVLFRQDTELEDVVCLQNAMMTSSNGNIFRVTGPLCREFTGYRWIPRTKASEAELWFL